MILKMSEFTDQNVLGGGHGGGGGGHGGGGHGGGDEQIIKIVRVQGETTNSVNKI